jgi:8-oxo-dGTP pyrophosphatase MutT (NUDIX family)
MAMSEFYRSLRERVGHDLLLVPAVAAIVRDGSGRILFQQLHDDSWSLPAGALEPGESPAQGVVREVEEETGLVVEPVRIAAVLGGPECRVRYPNQDQVEYVVTVFDCRRISGALITSNDETKRLDYFAADSLPPCGFPYPAEIFAGADVTAFFAERTSRHKAV